MRSPSNKQSLENLNQIKKDNYIGKLGQEYSQCEVDQLIYEKMNKRAGELLKLAANYENNHRDKQLEKLTYGMTDDQCIKFIEIDKELKEKSKKEIKIKKSTCQDKFHQECRELVLDHYGFYLQLLAKPIWF